MKPPPLPNFFRSPDGLLPAIAQDATDGTVLMLAWMNAQAWEETLATGQATYFSRSRQQLWRKGETSGHTQKVVEARVDCDADTILLRVLQVGAACHENYRSCFFRSIDNTATIRFNQEKLLSPSLPSDPQARPMSAETRLHQLQLELPPAPKPVGVYKPIVILGNLAYLSGHGPLRPDKTLVTGRLGDCMDVPAGYQAARVTGLALLATLRENLGSLDRVVRLVKLLGLVRCTDAFDAQPAVINGCSELFREVFGEDAGVGARSALGTNALPGGIAVEIEAIFEIRP